MSAHRDPQLAAALAALEPPPLPADFYEKLRERLVVERDRRRGRRRVALVIASTAAVAAATTVVALSLPERSPLAPEAASAAAVKKRVAEALATIRTLRGTIVVEGVPGDVAVRSRGRFVVTAAGDARTTLWNGDARIESAFDASTGVRRELEVYGDGTASARVIAGVAPGPPDDHGGADTFPRRDLAAYVQALLASADPAVRGAEHEGRPAWLVDLPYEAPVCRPVSESCDVDVSHLPDRLSVTVDRLTGLVVRVLATRAGDVVQEIRLEGLVVDRRVSVEDLELRFPEGVDVVRQDEGFRRVSFAEAAAIVGYVPPRPRWLPARFELGEVAVVPPGLAARPANRTNPESTRIVSSVYRRGLERIVVTTRARGGVASVWTDPFAAKATPADAFQWRTQRRMLRRGAFAGAAAEIVVDPQTTAHLWAAHATLVATVAGDAGAESLLRIAESLEQKEES